MSKSAIEWTEHTWNPIVGCSIVSPGCTNCYAMKMASRIEAMGNQPRYAGTTRKVKGNAIWTGKLAQAPESALLAPLRRKKPTVYFVNSMGDLFHEDCPDEWIDRVFAVMALCPQHTFQVLTKRAARMRAYMTDPLQHNRMELAAEAIQPSQGKPFSPKHVMPRVLPNVWLGVSTERQPEADLRIPELLRTPAAVRFISYEPALGAIDINRWLHIAWQCSRCEHLFAGSHKPVCPDCGQIGGWTGSHAFNPPRGQVGPGLDWVICGGESGPNARPMHPDWARSLRSQCAAANVPFFFKQWGCWAPGECADHAQTRTERCATWFNEKWIFETITPRVSQETHYEDAPDVYWLGKKGAGRHLDGALHNGMPGQPA